MQGSVYGLDRYPVVYDSVSGLDDCRVCAALADGCWRRQALYWSRAKQLGNEERRLPLALARSSFPERCNKRTSSINQRKVKPDIVTRKKSNLYPPRLTNKSPVDSLLGRQVRQQVVVMKRGGFTER